MLSFDLRQSCDLPVQLSTKNVYILIHTYLPTMIRIVTAAKGTVVGLRGDGAIAMFGVIKHHEDEHRTVSPTEANIAVRSACGCGGAIVEAMKKVVNPLLLESNIIPSGFSLEVGVGIDVGEFVATNIGLGTAHELTAYGPCVNTACKRAGQGKNQIVHTAAARKMYPVSANGTTKFKKHPTKRDVIFIVYPEAYSPFKLQI